MKRAGIFLSPGHRAGFRELQQRRAAEGWKLVAMNDETGRRGIWMRATGLRDEHGRDLLNVGELHALEVCAGREGGDWRVSLYRGQVLTGRQLHDLHQALDVGRWMVEEGGTL